MGGRHIIISVFLLVIFIHSLRLDDTTYVEVIVSQHYTCGSDSRDTTHVGVTVLRHCKCGTDSVATLHMWE